LNRVKDNLILKLQASNKKGFHQMMETFFLFIL